MPSATLIEKCCLIANPVAGNPTQYLVEQAFALKGLDWRFMSFEVEPERLVDAMRGLRALGFHGIKIGEPFQEAAIEHLDELTEAARRCGSVNCVTAEGDRCLGDNTEGAAFVELLRHHVDPAGAEAMIVGDGRLARAIAAGMADAGVAAITVASRNATTGQALADLIRRGSSVQANHMPLGGGSVAVGPKTAIVVNATSLGASDPDAKLPINVDSLQANMVVADVSYSTPHTWLTRKAEERGCPIIDGLALYVQQTALALRAWTGVTPDIAPMREAAEEFLGI